LDTAFAGPLGSLNNFSIELEKLSREPSKLDFFGNPPFQRHAPSNATIDAVQSSLCDEEVDTLITKGAVVEAGEVAGYISRYFLVAKKGPNEWRPIINLKPLNQFLR
jgi:hypothetical protein